MQLPRYHFTSPIGADCFPFDPNGAVFWKGRYHLGFIYQESGTHHFGHVSSTDLLNWTLHAPMLTARPEDPEEGIYSGNAFVDKQGRVVLHYHGAGAGNCIAIADDDDLIQFRKLSANPVMKEPGFDPHGWVEGEAYYSISGGMGTASTSLAEDESVARRFAASLYRSLNDEQTEWQLVGDLLSHDMPDVDLDEDVACPDLFSLGDKRILLCISHTRGARYYIGRFENEQFHPDDHFRMSWPGGSCFAPETLLDDRDRRIFWAWAPGSPTTMTLPRVLSLGADGQLRIEPIEELDALRLNHRRLETLAVAPGADVALDAISGDSMELHLNIDPQNAVLCGVKVRCSPDGREETTIGYDAQRSVLRVDLSRSSLDVTRVYRTFYFTPEDRDDVLAAMEAGIEPRLHPTPSNPRVTAQEAPFALRAGERLDLRVFLDKSMLEVFANGRQCLTQRIYPTVDESIGVKLFSSGDEAAVASVDSWDMAETVIA
jgi:sucrose-6-phosphate hydrolase SacC (GH32 family)